MSIFGLYDYLEWRDHPLVESSTIALVRILLCRYVGAGLSLSLLLLYSLLVVLSCSCTLVVVVPLVTLLCRYVGAVLAAAILTMALYAISPSPTVVQVFNFLIAEIPPRSRRDRAEIAPRSRALVVTRSRRDRRSSTSC